MPLSRPSFRLLCAAHLGALLAIAFSPPAIASEPEFDKGWRFRLGDPKDAASPSLDDRNWEEVRLPHTWNDVDTFDDKVGYHRGPGWYRKGIAPEPLEVGSRMLLELDGATSRIDVYLNGRHVARHVEGWAGFVQDLTAAWRPGEENVLALRADNSEDRTLSPGKPDPDYIVWGGIFRHARLTRVPAVHFVPRGFSVRPVWETGGTEVRAREVEFLAEVRNDSSSEVPAAWIEVAIGAYDGEKVDVSGITSVRSADRPLAPGETTLLVAKLDPMSGLRLWSPEDPAVYQARFVLHGPPGEPDATEPPGIPFGLRKAEFDPAQGFLLNGKKLKLRGFNRHEDYPGIGNALPFTLSLMDASLIRGAGGNFVRTSHYPQSPEFLEACDGLGILVLEEVTTWKYTGGWAWRQTMGSVMREMVRRDRTHPSVILWGMMNEGRNADLFREEREIAHAEDPTRPTIYAEHKFSNGLRKGTIFLTDVLGLNYSVESYPAIHEKVPAIPLISTEYANASHAKRTDLVAERRQTDMILADLQRLEAWPFMAGGALWCQHDYATERKRKPGLTIRPSGVLDSWRIPKAGLYAMKTLWSVEPVVHIEGHWTWPGEEGKRREVRVYTNCKRVELALNGKPLGEKTGGPIVSWDTEYAPGELVAQCRGEGENAKHCVRTTGPATATTLAVKPAPFLMCDWGDGRDLVVRVVDEAGNLVPTFHGTAHFEIEGPGRLRGVGGGKDAPIEGGIGKILVQEVGTPGTIKVRAKVEGFAEQSVDVPVMTGSGPGAAAADTPPFP